VKRCQGGLGTERKEITYPAVKRNKGKKRKDEISDSNLLYIVYRKIKVRLWAREERSNTTSFAAENARPAVHCAPNASARTITTSCSKDERVPPSSRGLLAPICNEVWFRRQAGRGGKRANGQSRSSGSGSVVLRGKKN